MIVVGSVRPGRIGLPIARWVEEHVRASGVAEEIDFVDLAELNLPFMDEPQHPAARAYTKQHTIEWSARVDAADAVILVMPEYNHSYSPALKNAMDFLFLEWSRKPVGVVAYGGVSGGSRSVIAMAPVLLSLGMVRAAAVVEMPFAAKQVTDGVFASNEKETAILGKQLAELDTLATALLPLQQRLLAS